MILGNLLLAFVTGLISSLGHCIGMCGGIVAVYSARQSARARTNGLATRLGALLPLHAGRLMTYAGLGALMGLAGALLEQIGGLVGWQGILSIVVGVVMLLLGLSLMGILPPIEVALASFTRGAAPLRRMKGARPSAWSGLELGLLWGLLPCGLVFAMLINSADTQTAWGGALTMLTFGLGTVPALLGLGLATNALGAQLRGRLNAVAASLIFLFGAQAILRGLAAINLIPSLALGPVMLW